MTLEISRLSNGLIVVSDPMPGLESAAVGIWVNTGSRNEHPAQMGVSHMLEHMAFKGTARRSARAIAEEIEAVGGVLNAYTSREQTAFHARVLKEDVPLALDMIGDILTNPTFEPSELERERQVVLQELGQARDTPDDIVFDHLQSAIFKDQPLGWPILGEDATVNAFDRDVLKATMAAQYRLEGMTLIASGAVNHAEIVALAEEKCAGLTRGAVPPVAPAHYVGGDFREERDIEQAHILLGFPGFSFSDPDYYAASLLSTALGGGMSSRLFQEVREKRGLVYSVYSYAHAYSDGGVFGIYAGTGPEEVAELIPVLCEEIRKLDDGLAPEELERARAQLKAGLLMSLESTMARCEQQAGHMLVFGTPFDHADLIRKIDAVDQDALKRVARRLHVAPPTVTGLGPVGRLESYARINQRLNG